MWQAKGQLYADRIAVRTVTNFPMTWIGLEVKYLSIHRMWDSTSSGNIESTQVAGNDPGGKCRQGMNAVAARHFF